jgi:hypothetical protein
MPIELAGISNVNEFYSEHYLQTVFEGDVHELRARWRDEEKAGGMPADRRLEKAGARWRLGPCGAVMVASIHQQPHAQLRRLRSCTASRQ